MIDKITPRGLDKSSDHKLVSKTSMIDALNLYIADDYINEEGNAGLLKSIRGNVALEYGTEADRPQNGNAHVKVIGSVTDTKTKIVYMFVWSQFLNDHGVWAYDPFGKLPTSKTEPQGIPNSIRKIITPGNPYGGFRFEEHGFVKGDIVYTNSNEFEKHDLIKDYLDQNENQSLKKDFEKDILIYFTDNVNEPRRLNVYRALLETNDPESEFNNYSFADKQDLICACPKVPLERITFDWDTDEESLTNNFSTTAGFQYAYQAIYKDKIESSISVYSTIAFPPNIVNRGAVSANILLSQNVCLLTVPELSPEVESIRILARYGNTSNFFEIDEVPNVGGDGITNWNPDTRVYTFRNDRVGFGVAPNDVDKTFDNVPRKAQAQANIQNRLVYGNYLEGFDNVKTDCTSRVIYNRRPPDYLNYVLTVHPAIYRTPYGNNKCAGFEIDTSEFASQVYAGTTITVTVNYKPDRNFHIYQADGSYHQSRQVGSLSGNPHGFKRWPLFSANNNFSILNNSYGGGNTDLGQTIDHPVFGGSSWPNSPAKQQENGDGSVNQRYDASFDLIQTQGDDFNPVETYGNDPSQSYLQFYGERYFGRNYGVGSRGDYSTEMGFPFYSGANAIGTDSDLPIWRHSMSFEDYHPQLSSHFGEGNIGNQLRARYGTSAGNPLILKGETLTFRVKFEITQDELYNGRKLIQETVAEALAGAQEGDYSWSNYTNILEVDNKQTVAIDLGLYNETNQENYEFPQIVPGDENSYLIVGVGESRHEDNEITAKGSYYPVSKQHSKSQGIPMGYFIVNKAEVDFYLELVDPEDDGMQYPQYSDEIGVDFVTYPGDTRRNKMRLSISRVEPEQSPAGIMTCIKKIDPRSPWWVVSGSVLADSEFQNSIIQGTSDAYNAFKIENPMFVQQNGYNFIQDFIGEFAGPDGKGYFCNRRCFGYFQLTEGGQTTGTQLFKPHTVNQTYEPVLGQNRFRFSLMDGEGGPGGREQGDTAYSKYGNADYGSVLARVDIDYDYSHCQLSSKKVNDVAGQNIAGSSSILGVTIQNLQTKVHQAFIGGVQGGQNISLFGPRIVTDPDVIQERELTSGFVGYLLSGPFFSGSIAMNPLSRDNANTETFSNPHTYPHVKDYSTTLPLIWVNSRGIPLHKVDDYQDGGPLSNLDSDFYEEQQFPPNWLQTSYPWPQTIVDIQGADTYTPSGEIVSFSVDPLPFREPYSTALINPNDPDEGSFQNPIAAVGDGILSPPAQEHFGCVDWSKLHSHVECIGASSVSGDSSVDFTSFKSSAMHEFGVVYYDERGRHGAVNHLDSVYVGGYSTQERGADLQGNVQIELTLNHTPPDWATNYKIVYSKNTSVVDFVQYSAGGAFIVEGNNTSSAPSRIYVSLNHLQGRPISYTHAWGASDENIELTDSAMPLMYTFRKGDRLRVISYMLPPEAGSSSGSVPERVYPLSFEFEVADMVALGENDNPLIIPTEASDNNEQDPSFNEKQGLFLVLKNNSNCLGFRYEDVRDQAHRWGDNCVFEIFSPAKELDADDRLYYEIGDVYDVRDLGYTKIHSPSTVIMTEGDVFFRRAAVNFREYSSSLNDNVGGYETIIPNVVLSDLEDNPDVPLQAPESNFKSYYIESPVASDLFKSNSLPIGRPNAIDHDAQEFYKEASIIHSERDITNAGKVSYSSFNPSLAMDKDLDLKSGPVNYLINHDDSLFFIQKDKCGSIPIDRTLISDVMGEESLIASSNFIGTPRYYVGQAGADDNPESVVNINNTAYFAHKSLGKVYRASGVNGVNVISDIGMSSYIRDTFNRALSLSQQNGNDVRVVGGYDPIQNEYLLSILNPITYGLATPVLPPPPPPPDDPDPEPDPDVILNLDLCKFIGITQGLITEQPPYSQQNLFFWIYTSETMADVANALNDGVWNGGDLWDALANVPNGAEISEAVDFNIDEFINTYLLNDEGEELTVSEVYKKCGFPTRPDTGSDPTIGFEGEDDEVVDPVVDEPVIGFEDFNGDTVKDPVTGDPVPIDIDPLKYTGDLCDYPALVVTALEVVTQQSITSAYEQVISQISQGDITHAQATYIFPDFNNDGYIDTNDLVLMLQIPADTFPVSCAIEPPPPPPVVDPLPYTGNLCDYDALVDSNGNVTSSSIASAFNSAFGLLETGSITPADATYLVPDINGDGAITTGDHSLTLNQLIMLTGSVNTPFSCTVGIQEPDPEEEPDPIVDIDVEVEEPDTRRTRTMTTRRRRRDDDPPTYSSPTTSGY